MTIDYYRNCLIHFARPLLMTLALTLGVIAQASEVAMRTSTGAICLRVQIESRPVWFEIDSGIGASAIDPALARAIRLEATGERLSIEGVPAEVVNAKLKIGKIHLGTRSFAETRIALMGKTVRGTTQTIQGCLGADILRELTLGFDFDKCRAWVWNNSSDSQRTFWSGRSKHMLAKIEYDAYSRPYVNAEVCGRKNHLLLDLGSRLSFLNAPDWKACSSQLAIAGKKTLVTPHGAVNSRVAIASRITVSRTVWANVPVTEERRSGLSGLGWTLLSGLGRVVLDFRNSAIFVVNAESRLSALDCAMSLYGMRFRQGQVTFQDGQRMRLKDFSSFFGIPVKKGHPLDQPQAWTPKRIGAMKLLDLYYPSKSKSAYVYERRRYTTYFSLVEPLGAPV